MTREDTWLYTIIMMMITMIIMAIMMTMIIYGYGAIVGELLIHTYYRCENAPFTRPSYNYLNNLDLHYLKFISGSGISLVETAGTTLKQPRYYYLDISLSADIEYFSK